MNTENFLNKLEGFLDSNQGLSHYLDKDYKLYLQKLKFLSYTNKSLIQLHWFITQIASETSISSVTTLTLNTFYEILKPSACSIYLLNNDKDLVELDSINKKICEQSNDCDFIKKVVKSKHKNINFKNINCNDYKKLCHYSDYVSYPYIKEMEKF